jgi:predicted dehydrogenase
VFQEYPPSLRVAIAGTGGVSRVHGARARDLGATIVGVTGRSRDAAKRLANDLGGGPAVFDDVGVLLDETRPDVLHVCSVPALHAAQTLAALERGIHVICEKPMAISVAEADTLVAAADAAGVHAAVCFTKRSYPMAQELRARVQRGDIGSVMAVRGGFLSADHAHDRWSWAFEHDAAGPSYATADLGSHWIDLLEHVTGRSIVSVDARLSALRTRWHEGAERPVESDDHAEVRFALDDGTVASAIFSGVVPGEPNGLEIDVDGTEGGLSWRVDTPDRLILRSSGPLQIIPRDPDALAPAAARLAHTPAGHAEGFGDAFRNLFGDVYWAIAGRHQEYPTLRDGRRVCAIVEAILESSRMRQTIAVT